MRNILIILSDQHNKSVLGCAGDQIIRTPNLNNLSQNGVRFVNAYASSPLCVPSRTGLLTSRLPSRTRVWCEATMSSAIPTIAHVMALAGYETTLIGRMHFIGYDQRHGFENRIIGEYTARFPGTKPIGGPPWKHYPSATAGQFRLGLESSGYGNTFYQYFDSIVTEKACEYLANKGNRDKKPFFAVVGYMLPHCPYIGPKDLFEYYYNQITIPEIEEDLPESVQEFRAFRGLIDPPVTEHRIRVARAAYYALVEVLDNNIGKIIDALIRNNLLEDTIVIYLSDHGDMIGEHGCWWKSMYYEGSVGVPMIFSNPLIPSQGRISNQLSSLIDIGPTLFELVKAKHIHDNDGISLLQCITEVKDIIDEERVIISEMVDIRRNMPTPIYSKMVRKGNWKIWQAFSGGKKSAPVLFNLSKDPKERNNLNLDLRFWLKKKSMLRRLYSIFTLNEYLTAAKEAHDDLTGIIQKYGKLIEPYCEDTLAFPDSDIEKNVTLL